MNGMDGLKILAVDSSSMTGSVALCCDEVLVAESLLNVRSTHSEKLLQQIDLLLNQAGWQLADLDVFVVVTGPGSFTGLRIGIATVKGLAQVADKPVVPVSSLQTIAMNLPLSPYPVCAFLDARKQEVYTQLFEWDRNLGPIACGESAVLPPQQVLDALTGDVAFVGDGVLSYRQLIDDCLGMRAHFPAAPAHQLRASHAAWLGLKMWQTGQTQSAADIVPTYIRPSDAELNLSHKRNI
jgi:tRNA threonylcarbamoyladenosine biosynthesis protein TsaB